MTAPAVRPHIEDHGPSAQLSLFTHLPCPPKPEPAPAVASSTPTTPPPDAPLLFKAPDRLPDHLRWREVDTPLQRIGFQLRRSRRRSIGLSIQDGGLVITAPKWVTLAQIDEAVVARAHWIIDKLRQQRARQAASALAQTHWRDGGHIPYLGNPLVLRLDDSLTLAVQERAPAHTGGHDMLRLPLPANAEDQRIRDSVHAWLQQQARQLFDERLAFFVARSGASLRGWRLSSARTRWGSCSSDGRIMLNWRLIHYTLPAIDYVIAHEVAHLRELHHGPSFWQEVARLMPDYATARELLRPHQPGTLPLLTE